MLVSSLQSRVNREQALRLLSPTGVSGAVRRWFTGRLLLLAEIYVPYRLYKVVCEARQRQTIRYYAFDALGGTLDPYEFPGAPARDEFVEIETRNVLPARLEEVRTRELAIEKTRRIIFSKGFFRFSDPRFTAKLAQPELYIPYWAGFFGSRKNDNSHDLRVVALDAVRRTIEGGKASQAIKAWLLERAEAGAQAEAGPWIGAPTEGKS